MTGTKIKSKRQSESKILVTGGTGYIGSHTVVALMQEGYCPVLVDNLSNSKISVLKRIGGITGREPTFYKADLLNTKALNKIFQKHSISSVIHFAGLKAVSESVLHPLQYYRNNIEGSLSLFSVMSENGVKKIIFSSSASIYGQAAVVPIKENCPPAPTNPYARSKFIIEQILNDIHVADPQWEVIILRYFNPVGSHQSGLIGEDPQGIPNNLMPYISQVAVGRLKKLQIFGKDYPTPDGTGVRDYIHIMDLAEGHVAALRTMEKKQSSLKKKMPLMINLGTGHGCTVMEMVQAFEKVSGRKIPYRVTKRRAGDIAACYADVSYAKKILRWKAKRSIEDMCYDTWRWQSGNPQGY
jgi:UDP-glucose 4-epimerase